MSNIVLECVRKLPVSSLKRMQIERLYYNAMRPVNKLLGRRKDYGNIAFQPLVYINRQYGNEYLLRHYSETKEVLYAIIEHGLFFGNNTQKIRNDIAYDLGCILTYGEYRKKLINKAFENYYCETIGAPILYADSEEKYIKDIKTDLQITGKVLLFFPAHGIDIVTPKFSTEILSDQLLSLASENGCNNIIISNYLLSPSDDLYKTLCGKARDIKILVYSCGSRFDQEFLFRQRALISLSAITASNSLGTHVGNCVGLQKPHVIIKQEITYEGETDKEFGEQARGANWKEQFAIEQDLFETTFSYRPGQLTLTNEQYKLCDYYWGFSQKKTPEEIREIYQKCHKHALKFIKYYSGNTAKD